MQWLNDKYGITPRDYLAQDAMRQVQKCVGRVLNSKHDFSLVLLADKRYKTKEYAKLLPQWMYNYLTQTNSDLSTDLIVQQSIGFFKDMAQPVLHAGADVPMK
jgi:DNA excision repair protein ERCC-2